MCNYLGEKEKINSRWSIWLEYKMNSMIFWDETENWRKILSCSVVTRQFWEGHRQGQVSAAHWQEFYNVLRYVFFHFSFFCPLLSLYLTMYTHLLALNFASGKPRLRQEPSSFSEYKKGTRWAEVWDSGFGKRKPENIIEFSGKIFLSWSTHL